MISGSANVSAKLTESDVLRIVSDPRPGVEIAKDLGVSNTVITNIRTGKAWAWLTGIEKSPRREAGASF